MMKLANISGLRFIAKHPMQSALSLIGIALGVAVIVSIDIANSSAGKAFELSMQDIRGKSTHRIIGNSEFLNDSIYTKLKSELDLKQIKPIIRQYVRYGPKDARILLLGIEPFAELASEVGILQRYFSILQSDFIRLIIEPYSAIVSSKTASEFGFKVGDTVNIKIGVEIHNLVILAVVNDGDKTIPENLIITDISTAQSLLGIPNQISSIDLIIPKQSDIEQTIEEMLPDGTIIQESGKGTEIAENMVSAFKTNLLAMSLLALIVGMFLIYNTMSFSVVRRRNFIGLLRAIGVTRKEIFTMILTESLILGVLGSILGIIAGVIAGESMLNLVTRSINDLYYVLNVSQVEIQADSILKGIFVGIGATFFAALLPALDATKASAKVVLTRSSRESRLSRNLGRYALIGLLLVIIGIIILNIPSKDVILSYGGILPLIAGFALISPLAIKMGVIAVKPLVRALFGNVGNMAARSIIKEMSRTSVAIAALAIAVSSAIGVGVMVGSFRFTVVDWLQNRLRADIYISAPALVSRFNDALVDIRIPEILNEYDEVEFLNMYREYIVNTEQGSMHLIAANFGGDPSKRFVFKEQVEGDIWELLLNHNSVMISEPFSFRTGLNAGDSIEIPSPTGINKFNIAGVYYDYGSDMGFVKMELRLFREIWRDNELTGVGVFLKEGINVNDFVDIISKVIPNSDNIIIQKNSTILESSLEVFDRTFIIAGLIQLLSIGVAFIGILSSLMALQLERIKEFGVLRAIGFTPAQLRKMVTLQTGIMGLLAALMALPLGNVLGLILIYVINKRSFGWTLQYHPSIEQMLQASLLAVVAAVLAGIYPGIKMASSSPAEALREE